MKYLYRLVVIGLASVGVSAAPLFTHAAAPTIFISEVSWAGSSLSVSDEFIELFNASNETISLTDWSLHGAATSGEALALPKNAAIPPYSTYLITNYDINEDNSALVSPPNFVTSRLALPNTKLSMALVDARRAVLDRVGTGTGSPSAGSVGVSMIRVDASADGASDEAWAAASVSLGFKTGLTDLGTPGSHDGIKTQGAEAGEEVSEPASASEAKTNVEVISEPELASVTEVEVNIEAASEPEPIQVHPSPDNVITVIYRGYVFALNLPEQHVVESSHSTPKSIEAPNVPATNNVVQTVSPPSPELEVLMTSAAVSNSDPASSTSPATEPEPTVPAMSLQTLRFSEIYPNTVGNDEEEEYIEIENFGNAPVDLLGWSIQDAAEKIWTADGSFKLGAGKAVALPRVLTKIVLNNNEETLTLTHPNRQVIDVISYGKAEKGATYTRAGDAWSWRNPTPNIVETTVVSKAASAEATGTLVVPDVVVNASTAATPLSTSSSTPEPSMAIVLKATEETMSLDEAEESSGKASSSKSATPPGFRSMSIAQARASDLGTSVRVEGIVTALPGIFASQSFYMEGGPPENTQGMAGVQVYLHSADFPPLALGDRIRVSGVTSQNRGEARIKLSSREAIEVLGSGFADAQDIPLDAVGEATEARLVTVEALVESARNDEMTLVDGEAILRVAARERTGVSFAAIPSGSRVRVTGIVSESNGTYTLLPRSQSDISIVEMPANENSVATGIVKSSKPPTGLYGGILLLSMLATLGFWIARSRKDQDLTLTNA